MMRRPRFRAIRLALLAAGSLLIVWSRSTATTQLDVHFVPTDPRAHSLGLATDPSSTATAAAGQGSGATASPRPGTPVATARTTPAPARARRSP